MGTRAGEMSRNGHETKGQVAARNLCIQIEQLREMRWMVESVGDLESFDLAVSSLNKVLQGIDATIPVEPMVNENVVTSLLQNQEWINEAARAIRNVDPAATVVRAVRGFTVLGKPASINATVTDGSQWIVDQGKARKLSDDEVAESLQAFNSFLEQAR